MPGNVPNPRLIRVRWRAGVYVAVLTTTGDKWVWHNVEKKWLRRNEAVQIGPATQGNLTRDAVDLSTAPTY